MITLRMKHKRVPTKGKEFSPYRDKYKVSYTEDGNKVFTKIGTDNVDEIIQSYLPSTLLENIIKRATHDPSVLNRTLGSYADLTVVPQNMADAQEVINNAKTIFENLEESQRQAYNGDFSAFLGSFRTATGLAQFVNMNKSVDNKNTTSEVNTDA